MLATDNSPCTSSWFSLSHKYPVVKDFTIGNVSGVSCRSRVRACSGWSVQSVGPVGVPQVLLTSPALLTLEEMSPSWTVTGRQSSPFSSPRCSIESGTTPFLCPLSFQPLLAGVGPTSATLTSQCGQFVCPGTSSFVIGAKARTTGSPCAAVAAPHPLGTRSSALTTTRKA